MKSVDNENDSLQKFMMGNVRGELVELSATWQQVLSRQTYPASVKSILGQMMAAAALLSATLKFNGAIVMQIHGDGPIRLLVVECDSQLRMRATAKLVPDMEIDASATLAQLINLHNQGRFVITLDPQLPGQQPYQGIVPLDGDNMSTIIENYMLRSEQLETKFWLAANDTVVRGLLLQKLPNSASDIDNIQTWEHYVMLASTLNTEEILQNNIHVLLRRLFWQEDVQIFEAQHPAFECNCSREKVGNMLKMLGEAEIEQALIELGQLAVDCDFCGQHYEFDKIDCAHLFTSATLAPITPIVKH